MRLAFALLLIAGCSDRDGPELERVRSALAECARLRLATAGDLEARRGELKAIEQRIARVAGESRRGVDGALAALESCPDDRVFTCARDLLAEAQWELTATAPAPLLCRAPALPAKPWFEGAEASRRRDEIARRDVELESFAKASPEAARLNARLHGLRPVALSLPR